MVKGGKRMSSVLVVEDEIGVRRVLGLALARMGYTVAEADSVDSASDALTAFTGGFDLIVLDLNLPDESGWELMRRLNAGLRAPPATEPQPRTPPVVVMTAVRPTQRRLEEFRPAGLLLKPFPIDALIRQVGRVLARAPLTG